MAITTNGVMPINLGSSDISDIKPWILQPDRSGEFNIQTKNKYLDRNIEVFIKNADFDISGGELETKNIFESKSQTGVYVNLSPIVQNVTTPGWLPRGGVYQNEKKIYLNGVKVPSGETFSVDLTAGYWPSYSTNLHINRSETSYTSSGGENINVENGDSTNIIISDGCLSEYCSVTFDSTSKTGLINVNGPVGYFDKSSGDYLFSVSGGFINNSNLSQIQNNSYIALLKNNSDLNYFLNKNYLNEFWNGGRINEFRNAIPSVSGDGPLTYQGSDGFLRTFANGYDYSHTGVIDYFSNNSGSIVKNFVNKDSGSVESFENYGKIGKYSVDSSAIPYNISGGIINGYHGEISKILNAGNIGEILNSKTVYNFENGEGSTLVHCKNYGSINSFENFYSITNIGNQANIDTITNCYNYPEGYDGYIDKIINDASIGWLESASGDAVIARGGIENTGNISLISNTGLIGNEEKYGGIVNSSNGKIGSIKNVDNGQIYEIKNIGGHVNVINNFPLNTPRGTIEGYIDQIINGDSSYSSNYAGHIKEITNYGRIDIINYNSNQDMYVNCSDQYRNDGATIRIRVPGSWGGEGVNIIIEETSSYMSKTVVSKGRLVV